MFKTSTGLRNAMLLDTGLANAMALSVLRIYSGTVPATADASIGSAVLLCTVSVDGTGTGVTFDSAPTGGVILKNTSELWKGTNIANGIASFYRLSAITDDGAESLVTKRCQGEVGLLNSDLILATTNLFIDQEQRVDYFAIGLPGS